jgi:hypothetical protein
LNYILLDVLRATRLNKTGLWELTEILKVNSIVGAVVLKWEIDWLLLLVLTDILTEFVIELVVLNENIRVQKIWIFYLSAC